MFRVFENRVGSNPRAILIFLKETTVTARVTGDARFVTELRHTQQHHIVVTIKSNGVHFLDVTRFIQANISTSPVLSSWAMTGTRPLSSQRISSSQLMPRV